MAGNRKLANIGKAVDSAASGDFLGLNDSGGIFKDVQWTNITGKPTVLDSAATINLIDSAYVQARQTDVGIDSAAITNLVDSSYVQLRVGAGGLDSGLTTGLIDSAYISARVTSGLDSSGTLNLVDSDYISSRASASSGFSTFKYTATAGQTTFDSTDANGNTLSYTADGILVFYNGILMLPTYDYTATDGTSVVLTAGADSGSIITIGEWALGSSSSSSSGSIFGDRAILFNASSGTSSYSNSIEYFDITTTGNTSDFGDLLETTSGGRNAAGTDGTYAVFQGPSSTSSYQLQYVTIATTGNSSSFGENSLANTWGYMCVNQGTYSYFAQSWSSNIIGVISPSVPGNMADTGYDLATNYFHGHGCGNTTYGLFGGVRNASGYTASNTVEYLTFASLANSQDFGDLTQARYETGANSSTTRGVWGGGYTTTDVNTIDYVTIATPGNATDFGDLTQTRRTGSAGNGTRGTFIGGRNGSNNVNTIDYVTIDTTGNATDFGDMISTGTNVAGTSGSPS